MNRRGRTTPEISQWTLKVVRTPKEEEGPELSKDPLSRSFVRLDLIVRPKHNDTNATRTLLYLASKHSRTMVAFCEVKISHPLMLDAGELPNHYLARGR